MTVSTSKITVEITATDHASPVFARASLDADPSQPGPRLTAAVERARAVTESIIPLAARQAEIIDLCLAGLTVPQMRALFVAHYSGQMMPASARRPAVVAALRFKVLASI